MSNKAILRKKILDTRSELSTKEVREKSNLIFNKLIKLKEINNSNIIMCYINFNNEVITKDFIKFCLNKNKIICIPLVIKEENRIVASKVENLNEDLIVSSFGILEPKEDKIRLIDVQNIDVVIVPGIAFDVNKNRIGYGKGYYDRFLSSTKSTCYKIGVAFEEQIVENVPVEIHDVMLNTIITNKRLIK